MSQYSWANAPAAVRSQVDQCMEGLRGLLGANLMGIYLHGSLAMGCFNPQRSDIDLLVVTRRALQAASRRRMAELLLRCSAAPRPIEISSLSEQDLRPWRYPTPFDFHYGEDWRERYTHQLASGEWPTQQPAEQTDPDLAAHITITLSRGICLMGPPITTVFPPVPSEHYVKSIVADFAWAGERLAANPVYFTLNACRVYAYLLEAKILSKDEAGEWAIVYLPEAFQGVVAQALGSYRGQLASEQIDAQALQAFASYIGEQLHSLQAAKYSQSQM